MESDIATFEKPSRVAVPPPPQVSGFLPSVSEV